MIEPTLIKGATARDNRGSVSFINDFSMTDVKRMYMVTNAKEGMVRAWHGHKNEAKYVYCLSGSALVAAVAITDTPPSEEDTVFTFELNSTMPSVVAIPAGYANGFKSLTADATLLFFSTSTVEESKHDDYRYAPRTWDIWNVTDEGLLVT